MAKIHPQIRKVCLQDAPQLSEIINQAYRTDKGWTTEYGLVTGDRITVPELEKLISDDIDPILVAELPHPNTQQTQIVGCISAEASHLHPHLQLVPNSALVGLFAVSPEHQSRGIGSALFQAILREIPLLWPQCSLAVLWVIKKRHDISQWYERLGFKWTGEYRDFVMPEKALHSDIQFKIYTLNLSELGIY